MIGECKAPLQLALEAGLEIKVRKGEVLVRCSDATAKYLVSAHTAVDVGPFCRCRSFRLPHEPARHRQLRYGDLDWRTWEERKDFGGDVYEPRRSHVVPAEVDEVLQEWSA